MNIYYQNEKAHISGSPTVLGSSLLNVYDPMLELCTYFVDEKVTINGEFETVVAIDSLCIGYTNAYRYELQTREGGCKGWIDNRITIFDFDETIYSDSFTLKLEGADEPLYLGYLYLGKKTILPRFAVKPETAIALSGNSSRSFGGQVYGMRRATLDSFAVNFNRVALKEYRLIQEYVETVQNVEPHIIDPYSQARREFPPMFATLNTNKSAWIKLDEAGFYYTGSLAWEEAR